MVRDLLTHGAGAAVGALTHPKRTVTRAAGLAHDALGLGFGAARRATAIAVDRAAGVAGTVVPGVAHGDEFDAATPDRTTTPAPAAPDPVSDPATEPVPEPEPEPTPPTRATDPGLAASEEQPVSPSGMAMTDAYDDMDEDVFTPSGIPAADEATNPDTAETDLHQPDTEPLLDPATAKAVASEAKTMRKAASRKRG